MTEANARERMSLRLRESLLVGLLSRPVLLVEARTVITPDLFNQPDEVAFRVLWQAVLDVHARDGRLTYEAVMIQVESLLSEGSTEFSESEYENILGDNPDQPGLLYYALHDFDIDRITEEQVRNLVRWFANERYVSDPLRNLVVSLNGGTPTDMGGVLRDLQTRQERIHILDVDPVHNIIPDEDGWEDEAVEQFPTGIDFLDEFMNGGNVIGEMHGLLGPTGVGKTTVLCQLVVSVGRYFQWLKHTTGVHKVAYLFSYEQPQDQIRAKVLAAAADISLTETLMRAKNPLRDFSQRGRLKEYELKKFGGISEPSLISSEYDRYLDVRDFIRDHVRIVDMSGQGTRSSEGTGYVDEIVGILEATTARSHGQTRPGWFGVDYAQLVAARYLETQPSQSRDPGAMRKYTGRIADEMKRKVALRYQMPGWVAAQYNTTANKKSPATLLTHNEAGEAGTFAHPLAFCFCLGTRDPLTNCTRLNPSKTRHAASGSPPILFIDGDFSKLERADHEYEADAHSGRIVSKAVRAQLAGDVAEEGNVPPVTAGPRRQPRRRRASPQSVEDSVSAGIDNNSLEGLGVVPPPDYTS